MNPKKIALFASGGGSNAEVIMEYFKASESINVVLVVTNNEKAGVVNKANDAGVEVAVISNETTENGGCLILLCQKFSIDFIVLAGYLRKVPQEFIEAYPNKIINIHPALLPKYGGKGMYGMNVHRAVKSANETQTGITVHFVNSDYDDGEIIQQVVCPVLRLDTPEMIQQNVQILEHAHYAQIIEKTILL